MLGTQILTQKQCRASELFSKEGDKGRNIAQATVNIQTWKRETRKQELIAEGFLSIKILRIAGRWKEWMLEIAEFKGHDNPLKMHNERRGEKVLKKNQDLSLDE